MKDLNIYFIKKSLSLENGSGMTRKRLGNDSARPFSVLVLFLMLITFGVGNVWSASFSTTYGYSDMGTSAGKTWNLTDYEDKSSYWRCPASGNTSVATIPDVFKGKYITSAVTITINHATYGSGTNPSEPTFQIYTSSCGVRIPAAQSGTLATNDSYKNVVYTISAAETAYLGNDLNILITKPGKTIRLKSITVAYTYSDASTYTITWSNNGSTYTTTSVTQGRKATFPAAPSSCDGTSTTFYGWSTAEWSGKLDDISSKTVYTTPETMPVPTANTTYYAVFGLPGSETTATFSASDLSATPATSNTLEWKHTATGALLHLSGGQRYTGSPNTFSVAPGSTNYAIISGVYMTKVVAACTSTTYRFTAASAGTFSNPSSSNYQAAGINGFEVKLYAGNSTNQARATTFTVSYKPFSALLTNCASCGSNPTVTDAGAAPLIGSITSTSVPVQCASGISNIGGAGCSLTDYGFVWKTTSAAPNVDSDTKHSLGSSIATSTAFNYTITGLEPNTPYYIYAYATNGHGTGYSTVYNPTTLQRYAISYNNNGGSGSMASSTKDHGVAFALPANAGSMTKTGYHITQWRLNSAGGTAYPLSGSYTGNADATFYVDWEANTYQVAFNNNGGTGSMSNETGFTYGASKALTACSFTAPAHKYFIGWNTDKDATTALYTDGQSVSNLTTTHNGTVTLYAIWKDHTFTNYRTVCCTEMGTINNSLSLTQGGNSVTISGWTYNDASSTKPAESNLASYTVRMYKKNGASWDLVSGTASGGSAGTAGTRTGIATNSKSVTFTGLVVESEYKFTIEGIGAAGYCDIEETAITSINSTDVSSTPFKFRYSIYIDNGSGSGWAHHYITPTANADEGSVSITLGAHVTSYQFKIAGGFSGWWGQGTPQSDIKNGEKWTLNGSQNVLLNTGAGGAYVFTVDYSGTTNPGVTVTFPSADQGSGYKIYFDKSAVADWGSTLKYRIGNNSHNQNQNFTLVPGTDQFYVTTTPDYGSMDAWQIANNVAWDGSHSIYNYHNGDGYDITRATVYQDYAVDEDITIVPTSVHNTENSCQFWDVSKTSGMLTHTATITTPSHGTITISNTDQSLSATATTADLPHRTILTITATPATGYSLSSLTVNGAAFTSGNTHILAADATIAATFTAQTSTVTLDNNSATSGSQQTVTATYDATMPLVTTADGTPAVAALTRTGYTFNGWWDAPSGGNQYYTYSGSPKVIASARTWDKTGAQTLKAQWIAKEYTITLDREGGSTGAESVIATFDSGTLTGWSAPTKTGYTFGGYYSGDNGEGTLVISSAGVLQNSVTISAVNWTDASGHWIKDGGVTLYAKWTADEYTISYKDEGNVAYSGSNSALLPTTHTYGAATDLVDGVKSGYRFDGWFDNSTCTGSAITSIGATAITANTTYYAKWTEVYTVTWYVNGEEYTEGTDAYNTQVANGEKIGSVATAPSNSTLNCATKFMGWSTTPIAAGTKVNGSSNIEALGLFTTVSGSPAITDDTDFYAVFASQTNSNGYKYIGDAGTLSDGEKYIFVDSKTAGSAHALKAMDLAENSSAGKRGTAVGVTITSTAEGVLITTVNTDLEFEYASTGTKLKYVDGLTTKYLFVNGNGVGYKTGDSRSAYGTHQLYGWTNGLSNRYVYYNSTNSNFAISEDAQNMYAFIKQTPVYGDYMEQCDPNIVNVTYDANGGSTTCSNTTTDKREDFTVCSSAPTRDYYTFAGWLCSEDDEVYAANATIDDAVIDANFTLTAQWTPVSYTITYNYNGGSPQVSPTPASSYTVESSEITLQTPTKGHDRFEGWYENADLTTGGVKTTIPAGSHENKTYYAKWATRHEIIFDADGTKTTIYRAEDEALNASIAGQGSIPVNPSAPSACSSKVFVGWIAEEIEDETDDEPTFVDLSSTVNANKHYYAVWATSVGNAIAAVEDATFTGGEYESYFSKTYGLKANDKYVYKNSIWTSSDMTAGTKVRIKVKHLSNSSAATLTIALINSSGTVVTSTTLTTTANSSDISNAAYSSNVELTATTAVTGYKITLSNKGSSSGVVILAATREVVATRSAYSTSCCATNVTLSQNSPENGTIAFGKTKVGTCGDQNVSLTITPEAGYQLHSYEVATGSGKVATKSVSPAIALDNNSSAIQNITLTFADEANGAYDVTAAFSLMTVTSWTWTMHDGGGAVPDPLNLYVGQSARLDVAYTPDGVVSGKKTYERAKNDTYLNWVGGKQSGYTTISGKASTGENTTAVTFTHADGPTKTVNVKVLPLPLTHFVDLVHGKAFADVAATIVDNALSATKSTPTSDDWVTPNANDCESGHLHLVGWIREDWPALVAYLNGTGDAPTTTAIVGAGNDGSGHAYFFAPNASINVQTFNGVTFYAVWSKVE